jgi:heme exporter protein C
MIKYFTSFYFDKIYKKSAITLLILSTLLISFGTYLGLYVSPNDYQQGSYARIMYVHVPSAWLSMIFYILIASFSLGTLISENIFLYLSAISFAFVSAIYSTITLITGSLWGMPTWGTWWAWDARMTSMLILLIMTISYLILALSSDNLYKSRKVASVVAIVGLINIPIVKFSVVLWSTLHQSSSFTMSGSSIDSSMLKPLMTMFAGNLLFAFFLSAIFTKTLIQLLKTQNQL